MGTRGLTGRAGSASIWMIVALPAEARPLVDHFGLVETCYSEQIRIYSRGGLNLLISGVGSKRAAAGVAYAAVGQERSALTGWLNIGVGGHAELPRGTLVLANKILDRRSGETWYPQLVFESSILKGPVTTVDGPESEYSGSAVYEMEAAGFFPEAVRQSTIELVHVVKLVSDNSAHPVGRVTRQLVEGLIKSRLGEIEELLQGLRALLDHLEVRCGRLFFHLSTFRDKWHFTTTQDRQLEKLLRRLDTLGYDIPELLGGLGHFGRGAEVLASLRKQLDASPVTIE